MNDTTTKRKVAEHGLLNVNGGDTKKVEEAHSITYALVDTPQDVFTWTHNWAGVSDDVRMLAIFGAKTIATNTSSQIRQQGGDSVEQMEAIRDRFENMANGVWLENAERGGASIDVAVLAKVVCDYAAAAGKPKDYEAVLKELTEDKAKKSKLHDAFRKEYKEAKGKSTISQADALDLL